jgi:hypothetical protein
MPISPQKPIPFLSPDLAVSRRSPAAGIRVLQIMTLSPSVRFPDSRNNPLKKSSR